MRKQREAPPPSKWIRTRGGRHCEVVKTSKVAPSGVWYYRLWYGDVLGHQLWTLQDLNDSGVRWLKNRPRNLRKRECSTKRQRQKS